MGYGFASGINLFITLNVCEYIFWFLFSPITIVAGNGAVEFQGAIIATIHSLIIQKNKWKALKTVFFRSSGPNLCNFAATLVMASIMIYFSGFKRELTLGHSRLRGVVQGHKIKLFYVSTMPVILQSTVVSQIYRMQQYLYLKAPDNIFIQLLGTWKASNKYRRLYYEPVGGLFYYLSPVESLDEAM